MLNPAQGAPGLKTMKRESPDERCTRLESLYPVWEANREHVARSKHVMAAPLSLCLAEDELHRSLIAWLTQASQTIPAAPSSGCGAPTPCPWSTDPAAYRREVLNHIRDQAELLLGAAERQHARQVQEKKGTGPSDAMDESSRVNIGAAGQQHARGSSPTKHHRASTCPQQPLPTSAAGYSEAFPRLGNVPSTNKPKSVRVWDHVCEAAPTLQLSGSVFVSNLPPKSALQTWHGASVCQRCTGHATATSTAFPLHCTDPGQSDTSCAGAPPEDTACQSAKGRGGPCFCEWAGLFCLGQTREPQAHPDR